MVNYQSASFNAFFDFLKRKKPEQEDKQKAEETKEEAKGTKIET